MYRHDGILKETSKAWMVKFGSRQVWLPKSKCEVCGSEISMPTWLARKNGLDSVSVEEAVSTFVKDGNEAEARLAREEILSGELENVLKAIKKASELTGLSKQEIFFELARVA